MNKSPKYTQIIYSKRNTTILTCDQLVLSAYPCCVLPEHYFDLALAKKSRMKSRSKNKFVGKKGDNIDSTDSHDTEVSF